MARPPSLAARLLEPFASALWILFLIATAVVAFVWAGGVGEADISRAVSNPGLAAALLWMLRWLDQAWIILGAAHLYLWVAETEGLSNARRWAVVPLAAALAITASSALTSFPLGPIHFSGRLGMKIGPVPFGVPLFWFAIILSSRGFATRLWRRASHLQIAFATAALTLVASLLADPLATQLRGWWFWRPHVEASPLLLGLQNHATWFAAAFFCAFFMRSPRVTGSAPSTAMSPAVTFCVINGVFLLTHLARLFRN